MRGAGSGPLRIGLLLFAVVIVQVSTLSQVRVLGGSFDLLPLLVAALALYVGSVPAMVAAFAAGLLLDVAVGETLGATSLVLVPVAYAVGRTVELRPPAHGLAAIPIAVAATLGYVFGFGAVSFMLQVDADLSALVLREMLVTVLLNALLALPFFAFVRRTLGPVLAADAADLRRRRARPIERGPIGLRGLEV